MSFLAVLGGLVSLLFLLVPIGRVSVRLPENVTLGVSCPDASTGLLVYTMSQEHRCDTLLHAEVNATVRSCG